MFGDNQNFTAAAPQFYSLKSAGFAVSGNETIDLPLPVKRLTVHVQDSGGNPIANVGFSAFGPTNCELTFGPGVGVRQLFLFLYGAVARISTAERWRD